MNAVKMNLGTFKDSLQKDNPPKELENELTALWYDAKGNWDKAHKLVQSNENQNAAWVHAHLHREEGNMHNAAYWYGRADKPRCDSPLDSEWDEIAKDLLNE